MRFLLDTHLLLWVAASPERLSERFKIIILDQANSLFFSVASIWEIAIKQSLGRSDFNVDISLLRRGLMDNGYQELAIYSSHALMTQRLPTLHKDPFDRMLIAQATMEEITLLTADSYVSQYPGPIQRM
jgi:PIN domain nuclease of toxin-antitoxin system